MRKWVIWIIVLVYLIMVNDILAFSSEISQSEEIELEDTNIEERNQSLNVFVDNTLERISVCAYVDDDVFPEGAMMKASMASSDINKMVADEVYHLYSQDIDIINMVSVDIGFFKEAERVYTEDGSIIHFDIVVNIEETTGKYMVFQLKNESDLEVIPVTETTSIDVDTEFEENYKNKKQFSFDIITNSAYGGSYIFSIMELKTIPEQNEVEVIPEQNEVETIPEQNEVEVIPEQNEVETIPEQNEVEAIPEQNEVETIPEQNEVETIPEQNEVETIPEQNEVETIPEQNEVETIPEQNEVETIPEQNEVETIPEQNEVEAIPKQNEVETIPEQNEVETVPEQNEVETVPEHNETINIEGKVIWNDNNNQDGIRPEFIDASLIDDKGETYPISVDKVTGWKYSVMNLPKFKEGKKIKYSIKTKRVKGYEIRKDGYDIICVHIPETVFVEGFVMWDDSNNKDGIRPKDITVNLLVDGKKKASIIVLRDNKWEFSFGEFPKYESGKEIKYSIEEENVDGYETNYFEFDIVNIHKAGTANIDKDISDETNKKDKKKNMMWIAIPILCFVTITFVIVKRNLKD